MAAKEGSYCYIITQLHCKNHETNIRFAALGFK